MAAGKGNIKALAPPLDGFNRLRIGSLRVVYRQTACDQSLLEYADSRDRIYEIFQQIVRAMEEDPAKSRPERT